MILKSWVVSSKLPYGVLPDQLDVDFDALPVEIDLRVGFFPYLVTAALFLFGLATLLIGLLMILAGLNMLPSLFAIMFGGAFVYFFGNRLRRSYRFSRTVTFTPQHVKIQWRWRKVVIVPYENFIALRASTVLLTWGRSVSINDVLELVHFDDKLSVPIGLAYPVEELESRIRGAVERFGLPLWRQTADGYSVQNREDFGRPLPEQISSGVISVPSVMPPPPREITYSIDSDENGHERIHLRITQTLKSYYLIRAFFGLFGLAVAIWAIVGAGWLVGVLLLLPIFVPVYFISRTQNYRSYEDLELVDGNLTSRGNHSGSFEGHIVQWSVDLQNVTELFLNPVGKRSAGVVMISEQKRYNFAILATAKGQMWLRDYLLYYIHERYTPNTP